MLSRILQEALVGAKADHRSTSQTVLLVAFFGAFFIALEYGMIYSPVASWVRSGLEANPDLTPRQVDKCIPLIITRIVGFLHNAVQVPVAIWAICQPVLQADRLHAAHPVTHIMLCCAAGFFLHDAIACYLREPPMYIVHGATCCVGYTMGALMSSLHFYGALFLMWELSTPFVQLRWALHKLGKSETTLYKVNGLAMVATFFLARIAFGSCTPPLYAVCLLFTALLGQLEGAAVAVAHVVFYALLMKDFFNEVVHPTASQPIPLAVCLVFGTISSTICFLNYVWFGKMVSALYKIVTGHSWSAASADKHE